MKKDTIIVCGTGIAGLACGLGLARAGASVSLLGPRTLPPVLDAQSYHPRVYAISAASQALLDRLGVWRLMDARRITPVEAMEIYGDGDGALDLQAWHDAQQTLAWIVESGEIERALQQAVQVFGVPWVEASFASLNAANHAAGSVGGRAPVHAVHLTTDQGRVMQADLLVGADGARSPVRHAAGIHHHYTPYGDTGVVAHLDAEIPHQHKALQWFTGDSVLALLPMPDTAAGAQVSMVWSLPERRAREFLAMEGPVQQEFLASRVLAITGARLGRLRLRSTPLGFPLSLERSGLVAPGVALVGDAAHRVHPLAGQGLNLGLGDVQDLLNVIQTKETFRRAGDIRVLSRYRRARAEPVLAMSLVTDGLHRVFASQCAPLAWARNEGMRLVDRVPFLKRRLIQAAAGN
ncbi:FAD-dependent monooxygenase [Alcaligenaceae bacterium CGII-47]|nr:FAD-dependent monooxygenase [Alcaligenaceae bacterium CGII-47]